MLVIPISIGLSDKIYATYQTTLDNTILSANQLSNSIYDLGEAKGEIEPATTQAELITTPEAVTTPEPTATPEAEAKKGNIFKRITGGVSSFTKSAVHEVGEAAGTVAEKTKEAVKSVVKSVGDVFTAVPIMMRKLIEAVAVIIVTTCVIPLLGVLFIIWLVKRLTGLDVFPEVSQIPEKVGKLLRPNEHLRRRLMDNEEAEEDDKEFREIVHRSSEEGEESKEEITVKS